MTARTLRRMSFAAVVVTGVALLPPVQARAKAMAVFAEALGLPFPRPLAASFERRNVELDGVTGHLYLPASPAHAIVLLPGAAPGGKDDDRVVRVAESLARAERAVFVPDLALAERRFEAADIDRIVRSTLALSEREEIVGRPALLGFSYGGSFGLLAAADPRLRGRIDRVATFGAYFDLVGVVQAVTTERSLVDGRSIEWDGHPMAREVLQQAALHLMPETIRDDLRSALESRNAGELPAGAEAMYALLSNRDPARTYDLAADLPEEIKDLLRRFSPSSVAHDIGAPVMAMHSTDDPAVPYGEALRLAEGMPRAKVITVSLFRHVNFDVSSPADAVSLASDGVAAVRFGSWLLTSGE